MRHAVTLVEMLVAVSITSLIMILLWNLFGSGSRSVAYGTWYSSRTAELRTFLRMFREDLAKATYPSKIEPSKITVTDSDPEHHVGYKKGRTTLTRGGGAQELLRFHICKPDRTAMTDAPLQPADILCVVEAKGNVIHYKKSGTGDVRAEETFDKDVIRDVEWVDLALRETSADVEATLVIKIRVVHPTEKGKGGEETTTARIGIKRREL